MMWQHFIDPSHMPGELMLCHCRVVLPQNMVDILIGSQAEFVLTNQIWIRFL